jgi:hypothetical protein
MPKRIKHNDLTALVHCGTFRRCLRAYLKKCKEFFGEVAQEVTSGKPQAVKQQATSGKEKMLEIFIIFTSLFILNMLGVFTIII